ncbi:MAG: ribosome recycling factor [Pseudomonadota bacterium]
MVNDVLKDLQQRFDKVVEDYKRDLARVRTGRASLSLLDGIKVDYYGTMTPLNQVATLNVPDSRLITIKPWERSLIPTIERAIKAQSELGLNPASDGEMVRLPIPPLTQERRKELVKHVRKMAEDAKVAVRNARREANETVKELVDSGDVSEDDSKTGLKKIQELTDRYVGIVSDLTTKKEQEVMEI